MAASGGGGMSDVFRNGILHAELLKDIFSGIVCVGIFLHRISLTRKAPFSIFQGPMKHDFPRFCYEK